ncbi:MAG: extensin family protein [Pseudomonadota bacterium]
MLVAAGLSTTALADAPETSVLPVIRPQASPVGAVPTRPTLRPNLTTADLGENSPPLAPANEALQIDAALLAADAMRAVGAVGSDGSSDDTLVVAERNIDPETLNLELEPEPEKSPEPEVSRLAGLDAFLPVPRPAKADVGVEAEVSPALAVTALAPEIVSILPIKRPFVVRTPPPVEPSPEVEVASAGAIVPPPPPPVKRPRGLLAALFRAPDKPVVFPKEGSVCGDPAIRGQRVPPIPAKLAGCGLAEPVKITSVDGVALSTPATVSCGTAHALRSWVTNGVKPVVGKAGGGVSTLRVAGSYSCRTRNHKPGAKISEHGRGKAIDISAVILKDGTTMTVLRGWRHEVFGPMLKAMHARACGTFGTVLGPNSDPYHQDHFHFDIAKHGYGPYCR